MSHIRIAGRRLIERVIDARAEPPVAKMLVASLLVYALLCLYGFSRM